MPNGKRDDSKVKKALDPVLLKRGRGRPAKIPRSWVIGRAPNYRRTLSAVWQDLGGPLLAAESREQVVLAFEGYAQPYAANFVPHFAADIFSLIRHRLFPKRAKAQVGFLADSLAGRPEITARRSRDICAEQRAIERGKSPHKILRKEFYIECSCGYKGPARDNACRKCGAEISLLPEIVLGAHFG